MPSRGILTCTERTYKLIATLSPIHLMGGVAPGAGAHWITLRKVDRELYEVLEHGDLTELRARLRADPGLAAREMPPFPGHRHGASPLSFVAMLRYDAPGGVWREVPGTGRLAETLIEAGAPIEGLPGDAETPLMTAASYGDVEVATVLIEAGARLEATAAPEAGGVPGGTPLLHAAVFGMTGVVDVLVAAGAVVPDLVLAAAAGIDERFTGTVPPQEGVLALMMAADHERLTVIDRLVAAGVGVESVDPVWGRHPLRLAAGSGRSRSVRKLLELGADPMARDGEGHTALDICRAEAATHPGFAASERYAEIEALLSDPN
jgi:ankyrin repeat protein